MDVGKRITQLREHMNITTNRLANLCGLSQSFIRSVELGEKGITVENLSLICDVFHISLRNFFDVPSEDDSASELKRQIDRLSPEQQEKLTAFLKSI